ncbi:MAG: glycoside hydrolase family 3 C-terminal domain-containing protein [Clostridia bacterium]|nr:glycoside hydrolase family 3 C-terminal domain-containing protein [Clostridia bacterium]
MTADEILAKLTLEEKIALCSGKNFWNTKDVSRLSVPSLFMCDGPHGLRKQDMGPDGRNVDMLGVNNSLPATCFPTAVTTANSWDVELMERIGEAIGEEASKEGVGLVLGPGANIKRNPLCGRNFEYISEDPYLTGKMAAGIIRGIQRNGTAASLKHFACNNQEHLRFISDSIMDERTLYELYLAGFEIAVKEGRPKTLMCAYNKINGVHCSDDRKLLTDILRNEWGFDGMVVTDWGAMCDRIEGFKAGCDLNMPGGHTYMEKDCAEAIKNGTLSEEDVDASARRVLKLMLQGAKARKEAATFDKEAHHDIARKAAEQGAVLLKNEGGILPISEGRSVALIGAMAKTPRYQGSGSSHINPFKVVSPADAMPNCSYASGCDDKGDTTEDLLLEAKKAAESADVAVVFAGLPDSYESEGFDRENMKMPEGHIRMIEAVAAANPNTVVVLLCGSAVECPWADRVLGILYMGLSGQAVGEAAANLLYGKVNPCGKLAESWPYRYEDCVSAPYYGSKDAQYREGVYVGYRYYDKANIPVRWSFGYGLSYTSFAYSNLQVNGRKVSVTVTNSGEVAGAEVVQLYVVAPKNSGYRPIRELKGFVKVFLEPKEGKTVDFYLDDRAFSVWQNGWKVSGGVYRVCVGELSAEQKIEGDALNLKRNDWYDAPHGAPTQQEWETLIGRSYEEQLPVKGRFTMENSVMEMKSSSLAMRLMYKATERVIARSFPKNERTMDNPTYRMMLLTSVGGPLRSMQISSGIRGGLFKGLLDMANGHFFRGIGKMIKG